MVLVSVIEVVVERTGGQGSDKLGIHHGEFTLRCLRNIQEELPTKQLDSGS